MNRCSHDYVVSNMMRSGEGIHGLKAYYVLECDKCGNERRGTNDEIPTARFK